MKIVDLKNGKEITETSGGLCLVLGNFDGVHRGHTRLVDVAIKEARVCGLKTGVWTFADHPSNTLSGNRLSCLTDACEKNGIFGELGVDYVIYEDFASVRNYSPEEFTKRILVDSLDCRIAVCGFNFKFGKNGAGDSAALVRLMESVGRRAVVVQPVSVGENAVSSTMVRSLIEEGNTEKAMELLGRPYSVKMTVEHGKKLGRTLGMPTINQRFPAGRAVPARGIYACTCFVDGKEYIGVANVGSRPTVNADTSDINCETHIINYDGDLYGQAVRVSFYKKLRDEQRFSDTERLREAVFADMENAVEYFSKIKELIK